MKGIAKMAKGIIMRVNMILPMRSEIHVKRRNIDGMMKLITSAIVVHLIYAKRKQQEIAAASNDIDAYGVSLFSSI